MYDEYIEMLIDSIEVYDAKYHPPYFILLYIPANAEYDRNEDLYFAALATKVNPTEDMIDEIFYETKKELGNIVYAAEYEILKKDAVIDHLESLLS